MVAVSPLFAFWKWVESNSLTVGGGARKSWGKGQTTWVWINGHCVPFFPLLGKGKHSDRLFRSGGHCPATAPTHAFLDSSLWPTFSSILLTSSSLILYHYVFRTTVSFSVLRCNIPVITTSVSSLHFFTPIPIPLQLKIKSVPSPIDEDKNVWLTSAYRYTGFPLIVTEFCRAFSRLPISCGFYSNVASIEKSIKPLRSIRYYWLNWVNWG